MSQRNIVIRLQNWFRLFDSDITLESNNRQINAKSIMGIMAFNPSKGMTVNIVAEGSDEEEALVAMEKFLVCE